MKKSIKLSLISVTLLSSLQAQTITMKPITITSATKTEQSIKDITSNVNVITAEEIEEKQYTTVVQALNSIAGVNFTSNGGLGSTTSINLRGAGNSRVLVLIDGIKYNDPSSTSGALIQHLMIENIQRIEIIKGAQSGIWGADASAGVINIITKETKKGTHATANIEAGSYQTKKFGATISHKSSEFDIKFSASKLTSDGFSVQAPKGKDVSDYEDDAYENLTLNLKANYNITDSAKVGINITTIDAQKEYDSYGNPDDTTMKSDISDQLYTLNYTQKYNNHNIKFKVEQSEFSRDVKGATSGVKNFEGEHTNIELNNNIKYNEEDFIILGLGMSSDTVDYEKTDKSKNNKENKNNHIYLTNSNKINNLLFTQSARYDRYDNFDNKATGKLGLKYDLSKNIFITSNYGLAYSVPNIVQELNPWGAVNSDLNPENTTSFDISFGYNDFQVTYFHNKITDLIEWYDPDGWGGNPAIYKNLDGKSTFKGFEVEYNKDITDEFTLQLNYTALEAEDKDEKRLARKVKNKLNVILDYYPTDDLHLGLAGEYIGSRFDKADMQGEQTGKYTLVHFATDYIINNNFSVYGKIDNLTDKEYQTVDGYATAGRSFYLGLKAQY